jgi:uncharacterized membrane-anchored protein
VNPRVLAGLLPVLFVSAALAQAEPPPAENPADAFMKSVKPQKGQIALPGGIATLKLSDAFMYLTPEDSQKLIEQAWGNPPGAGAHTLGMIIPASDNPVTASGWGVVVTYNDDGHVSDEDADKVDYAELLKQMQDATTEHNQERQKQGFKPVTLVGWAEPPHYDASAHKIYWAKDLKFGDGGPQDTLNYCIRVLGRKGVLELNAVAGMTQLGQMRGAMKDIVAFTDFTAGNAYNEFDSGTDKMAAYGLAALVAGGVAAKAGLFAKLLALVIAGKKLVLVALAGIAAFFGKIFKRKPSGGPAA